jgi:hypothetical protein
MILLFFDGACIMSFFILIIGTFIYNGSVVLRNWEWVDIFGAFFLTISTIVVTTKLKNSTHP